MSEYLAGDIVFAHGKGFISRAIRLAERLRFQQNDAHWNHVAIITATGARGYRIVQAESRGVTAGWFASPADIAEKVEVVKCPAADRAKVLAFANAEVGSTYGYLTILSIAISLIVPWFVTVRQPGTWVCSALGAESLRAGGFLERWPDIYQVSPAQLYEAVTN